MALYAAAYVVAACATPIGVMIWLDPAFTNVAMAGGARLRSLLIGAMIVSLTLFGGLLAWAVADRISFKRRTQPDLRTAPPRKANDLIAIVVGLIVYGVFAKWLHLLLIGVNPLPM